MNKKQVYIYYIMTQYRNHSTFKVGYTTDLKRRMQHYMGHNTGVRLLEYAIVDNAKTGRILEKNIHKEQRNNGECFMGLTEWIYIPIDREESMIQQGLQQFDCIKYYNIKGICKVAQ